ncbi:MAG: NFACT RNA binding domain-containing protein [Sulfurovaceae bacterium]|nr:NFACT RNA binding domain-containing protein [Sulfurovaceae bacterium]
MNYNELLSLQSHLKTFKTIHKAKRIDDNTVILRFDKEFEYGFIMNRGNSNVYKTKQGTFLQNYNAPFDNLLEQLVTNSKIISVDIVSNDRVLRFTLQSKNSYKTQTIYLQFEFTGKFTNIIILNEDETIIEALRHIDSSKSFRVIRPNIKLIPLIPRVQKTDTAYIDIENILTQNYENTQKSKIDNVRHKLLSSMLTKQKSLKKILISMPQIEELENESIINNLYGTIILSNLNKITPYSLKFDTFDFEGNPISIQLPKDISVNKMGNYFFNKAKKAKKRALHIYIQKENINGKLDFLDTTINLIQNAKDYEQLSFFIPQKSSQKKSKSIDENLNLVWIENYKVYIGRNKNENKTLLEISKSNDIWMHIRDVSSSHVIIKTDKQNVPSSVIKNAAQLCVEYSSKNAGDYIVDYTKRKFVKPAGEANVFYTNYDSIFIRKEGIEIRT